MLKRLITVCLMLTLSSGLTFGQSAAKKYVDLYKEAAIRLMDEHGIPASIVLGIAIHESASGTSKIARYLNNHFGMKGYTPNKKIPSAYKGYESVDESYEDFISFMKRRSSLNALFDKFDSYEYKKWAYGIQRAGYAQSKSWAQQVIAIINKYKLYQYDNRPEGFSEPSVIIAEKSSPPSSEGPVVYKVKSGDTLSHIAKKFSTTVSSIKNANGLKTTRLQPGQRLKI